MEMWLDGRRALKQHERPERGELARAAREVRARSAQPLGCVEVEQGRPGMASEHLKLWCVVVY